MVWTFMKERGLKTAFGGKVSVETPCKADPNSKSKPGLRKPWQHLSKQWCEFQKKNQKKLHEFVLCLKPTFQKTSKNDRNRNKKTPSQTCLAIPPSALFFKGPSWTTKGPCLTSVVACLCNITPGQPGTALTSLYAHHSSIDMLQ